MDKVLRLSRLMDLYGAFLTDKQRDVLFQHNELDYSLAEIADNLGITRQAVHFAIKGGIEILENCEKNLNLIEKYDKITTILTSALDSKSLDEKNDAIKQTLLVF